MEQDVDEGETIIKVSRKGMFFVATGLIIRISVFLILFKTSLQLNFYRSFSFVVYFCYRYIFIFDQIDRRIKDVVQMKIV